jgi:hypothetical protein
VDKEELKKRILKIMDQFGAEEIGNRLSQFAMLALKSCVMQEVDKEIPPKKEE